MRSLLILLWISPAIAKTLHVDKSGSDNGDCSAGACLTLTHAISQMAGGDTLIVGDGSYAESLRGMPSGSASAYTTIQAEHDWGATIDGSAFANNFTDGIRVTSASYVVVRGFHVKMNQAND